MFNYTKNKISNNAIKYEFLKPDGTKLSYNDFISLLKNKNEQFLHVFREALNDATSELKSAYFWECVPISRKTVNKKFEFVVTKSTALNNINQSYSSFNEHFSNKLDKEVVSFLSLGKDATLISPVPKRNDYNKVFDYKNLSNFNQNAPIEQQHEFWQKVGEKMMENVSDENPKWLSTNGLGVHYLHVRIDSRPKYYVHQEYLTEVQERQEVPPKNPIFFCRG